MESNIDISVIMPVYNTDEFFLKKAIDSVLDQTFKNFEFIIVNDGSTTDVEEVILSYDDNRIKYMIQSQGGQSKARNTAIKRAVGKYIFYMDSDDWIIPDYFENLYINAEKNSLDILISNVIKYDNKTGETSDWMMDISAFLSDIEVYNINSPRIIEHLFLISQTPWGKLYKKDFLIKNNLFFVEGLIFEDIEIFFRYMCKAKRIGVLKEEGYFYRCQVDSSTMSKCDERHLGIIKIISLIETTLKENNIFDIIKYKFYDYKIRLIIHRYNNIQDEFKDKLVDLIKISFDEIHLNPIEMQKLDTKTDFLEFCKKINYQFTN